MKTSRLIKRAALLAALFISACSQAPDSRKILENYRAQAHAAYSESLLAAQQLDQAIIELRENTNQENLRAAREAWRAARIPYAQTEALRFGNWFVDDWEGAVNAWPLDEGFLDYVADGYNASPSNPQALANLIANDELDIGGRRLRANNLNRLVLGSAQALSDIENNVSTGYHAIEFMLWGQDLNGHAAGAGQRPWTDFSIGPNCTDGQHPAPARHCQRRHDFLQAAMEHLTLRLLEMQAMWSAEPGSFGDRLAKGDPKQSLARILHGLISMGGEELAAERMQVALLSQSPEEEQDCFSDDTHNSLFHNFRGIEKFYFGSDDKNNLARLARHHDKELAERIESAFAHSRVAMLAIQSHPQRFDQLIAPDNALGHQLIKQAIDTLQTQSQQLEQLAVVLELGPLNPQAPR